MKGMSNKNNTKQTIAIEEIRKQFGKGAIMMPQDHEHEQEPHTEQDHEHEMYYSTTLSFINNVGQVAFYKVIHHCRRCRLLDIKQIYGTT